ncbi:hypothetical protein RJT34_15314 [Clitoria ternatea]|uniref:Uncharacterized protein n=1 Tax=Clitoria ternatea TaxID=43366 RepID=A0AAN9JTR6_CLITE
MCYTDFIRHITSQSSTPQGCKGCAHVHSSKLEDDNHWLRSGQVDGSDEDDGEVRLRVIQSKRWVMLIRRGACEILGMQWVFLFWNQGRYWASIGVLVSPFNEDLLAKTLWVQILYYPSRKYPSIKKPRPIDTCFEIFSFDLWPTKKNTVSSSARSTLRFRRCFALRGSALSHHFQQVY